MKKSTLIICSVAIVLLLIVAVLPWITKDAYQGNVELEFNTAPAEIWSFVNDVHNIPVRLPKISKVEVLDSSQGKYLFKIYTPDNDWILLQSTIENDSTRTLHFQKSSFGYLGTWHYQLQDLGNETCKMIISENSTLNHYGLKFLLLITGRDILMAEEMRGIQLMAKEGL